MKRISKSLILILFIIITSFILSACSKQITNIRPGLYRPDEGLSTLVLEEYNTFILSTEDITSSYIPTGNYTIDGDKLSLHIYDEIEKDTIIFKIKGNRFKAKGYTLIFESGRILENQIEKGTKFNFREKEEVNKEGKTDSEKEAESLEQDKSFNRINTGGTTIEDRYPAPENYTRVETEANSFGEYLTNQKLKPYGEKALFYNGKEKTKSDVYDSVFDVDIGDRDLHQCADAVMLLRAEYLYDHEMYDEISFNFVSGFKAEYKKWMEGYRIKVDGNNVSYYKGAEAGNSYESFRKYMDMVMAYASTISLEKELESVNVEDISIGDVFIQAGSPGHAIIVVDMAVNEEDEKIFLLAQSYMPAQQTQVLLNPMDKEMGTWYSLKDKDRLITPEWKFELSDLKRF